VLRIFNSANPVSLILLLIYAAVLNVSSFVIPDTTLPESQNAVTSIAFGKWLSIGAVQPPLLIIANILCIVMQGILICVLLHTYKILSKFSLVPAMIYILYCSMFPQLRIATPQVILSFLAVWLLFKIFALYNKTPAVTTLFDIGLLNGIILLLDFSTAPLLLFSILAAFTMRFTALREILVIISGVLIVYFLAATAFLWFDELRYLITTNFYIRKNIPDFSKIISSANSIKLLIASGALIPSLIFLNDRFSSQLIQIRKYLGSVVLLLIFSALQIFIPEQVSVLNFYLLCIPAAIIIGYYLINTKNQLYAELIHLGLLGTVLLFQYVKFA
jgi:hypothetical protein